MVIAAIQSRTAWQPNPFGSVSIGVIATALVLAALAFIFGRPIETAVSPAPMEIRLISFKSIASIPHKTRIRLKSQVERLPALQPITIHKLPLRQTVDWQRQMDMAVQEYEQSGSQPPQFMVKQNPADNVLEKALQFRPKEPILRNGKAYRSIYGNTVLKSNGRCIEMQDIRIGPSPSGHTTVTSFAPCPDANQRSMSDELSKWADKRKAELSKPPR